MLPILIYVSNRHPATTTDPPDCWHELYDTDTYIQMTNIPHPGPKRPTDIGHQIWYEVQHTKGMIVPHRVNAPHEEHAMYFGQIAILLYISM